MTKSDLIKLAKSYNQKRFKKGVKHCLKSLKKAIMNRAKEGHYNIHFSNENYEWIIAFRYFRRHTDLSTFYYEEDGRYHFTVEWH